MLLGGPQNTIKNYLVLIALFCFAPFYVFSSRMSAPYCYKTISKTTLHMPLLLYCQLTPFHAFPPGNIM
jgi:hypothetical protein